MPEGRLHFDERGIAADGVLEHEGVELDLRSNGFVAILVSRAAVAPDAHPSDDDIIRRRLLSALRLSRRARYFGWALPTVWAVILGLGAYDVFARGESLVTFLLVPALILLFGVVLTVVDRRRLHRT